MLYFIYQVPLAHAQMFHNPQISEFIEQYYNGSFRLKNSISYKQQNKKLYNLPSFISWIEIIQRLEFIQNGNRDQKTLLYCLIQNINYYKMKSACSISTIFKLMLITILLDMKAWCTTLSVSVSLSVTTINANSVYSFTIVDSYLQTNDGIITITFPSTLYSLSGISCYNTDTPTQIYSCSVIGANRVNVTYVRGSQSTILLSLSIATVKNPPSKQTVSFAYQFSSGATVFSNTNATTNSLTPDSLTACFVTFSPSTTFTESTATFNFTTKNLLDNGASVTIAFPSSWQQSVSSAYTPLIGSSVTCSPISGSPLKTSFTCDTLSQNIQANSIFSATVNSNTVVVFTANRIRTPPTVSTGNAVTISTMTSASYLVDQSQCIVNGITEQSISITNVNSYVLGVSSSLAFNWVTSSPLKVGDFITINFPVSYMSINNPGGTVFLYDGKLASRAILTSNGSQQLRFNITNLNDAQISVGNKIDASGIFVQTFIDTSPRSIGLIISRSGFNIASGSFSITPTVNALNNASISSDIGTVSSAMSLNITFTTSNNLLISSLLRVQIPTSITTTGTSPSCSITCLTNPSAVLSSITCSISSNLLTVSSFLQNTLSAPATLVLTISNALVNPQTTQPTTPFTISTVSLGNYLIDQSSSATYTASVGTISSITIVPSSLQVLNENTYTLTYTISRTIRSASVISVQIPAQIQLSASPSYRYSINTGAFSIISPTVSVSGGLTTLRFSGIFSTAYNSGTVIKIQFNKLINPPSLKPSSSFQVFTSYNNYAIQQLKTGLSVTMTSLASFKQFTAVISDPTNGATKDYTFYIQPLIAINSGDSLSLQIVDATGATNQISFSTVSPTCTLFYSATSIPNSCSVTGSTLNVIVNGMLNDVSGLNSYRLTVSSFILARTPKSSSNFRLTSSSGGFGVQTLSVSSTANTVSNNIVSMSLNIITNPSKLNEKQQLKITFRTFNGLDLKGGQFFVIQIPTVFTYIGNGTALCTNAIFSCSIYNGNSYSIKVQASGTYSTTSLVKDFDVTLGQVYVSPLNFDFTTSYFYISTYTNTSLQIDKTDPVNVAASRVTFYRTCAGYCATCTSNTSFCLSCYQVGTGYFPTVTYGGFNTMASDNTCVDYCRAGYYNTSGTCNTCVSPCKQCTSATVCTSCVTGYYYSSTAVSTARCVVTCPSGTYAFNSSCLSCSPSCLTCSTQMNNCTSCSNGSYLSGTLCVLSCPDGTYQNITTNKCESCDPGCTLTCGSSANDCGSCKTGYFHPSLGNTSCINSCPSGTVSNPSTGFCECSSQCKKCSGTITNCTQCQSPLFLYKNTCISSCPAETYQPDNMTTCLNCLDTHCTLCISTACTTCQTNYYLYAGACVLNCPPGTRLSGADCTLCPTGCKSCLVDNSCTQCFSGYLAQGNQCVQNCSPGFANFNASRCVSACPTGYYNSSGVCLVDQNSTNNNNSTIINNTNATQSVGRIIPFPYTIAYVLVIGVSIGMRCLYPNTLLPSTLMSLGSILEIMSAFTLVIVAFIQFNAFVSGIGIIIAVIVLIYASNIVSLVLILKVLGNDEKFSRNVKRAICPNNIIRIISVVTYHKFHQIVFSNIFGVKVFCNKVDFVRRLYPFNVLLIISIVFSVLLVIGASLIGYEVQTSLLSSSTFIQSVDCIIAIVLNIIPTILVLRRKDTSYEVDIDDKQAKRYETQDQLNMNNDSQGIEEVFIEQGGDLNGKPSKVSQRRKNYYYQNSKRSQVGDDPYETPLDKKRLSTVNPITAASGQDGQKSSEALFFGKNKSKEKADEIQQEDIEQIMLDQPTGDNAAPPRSRKVFDSNGLKADQNNPMINYTGYDLDPRLLKIPQNSQQFKKLPSQVKAKIRLAKANMQINKNSQNFKKQTIDQGDVQQIQLSPKKNTKQKFGQQVLSQVHGSQTDLLRQSMKKRDKSNSKSKSKSKQKSLSKDKKLKKSKSPGKGDKADIKNANSDQKQELEDERMMRNRSEQMQKKQISAPGIKTTKSQNIKKKKKKPNNQIKVLFNGSQANNNQGKKQQNQNGNEADFDQQDEPKLPIFKQNKRKNNGKGHESDGLDNSDDSQNKQKYKRPFPSDRKSQNLQDQNIKNLRDIKGERTIPNQQPDDLPHLHSSEQLGNLVIVNRNLKNKKMADPQFSNDDSSIYKKIYNDQTETLKSVQGDNLFGQEISPSQFNVQNQRFEDTSASNDMPVPATFEVESDQYQKNENTDGAGDGFDQYNTQGIKRYSSNHNIDYDSVLSKRINNDRIKQLQKIYLPRLDVIKPKKKKK